MKHRIPAALLTTLSALLTATATWAADRVVSVSGQGEVQAEPDRASVTLGIESRKPKMDDARAEVSRTVDTVLKLTRDLKIDPKFVRATRLSVQPEYNWNTPNRERVLLGYIVSRQVEVDLRDLDKLGQLLERAVSAGVNQVGDAQLDSTHRRDLEREALGKAVEDSRLNAEAIAKAAGGKVGAVRTISASSGVSAPPMPMRKMAMNVAGNAPAGENYQSGQMTFNANVQAEFDLVIEGVK
jgi:uncharacterized protein